MSLTTGWLKPEPKQGATGRRCRPDRSRRAARRPASSGSPRFRSREAAAFRRRSPSVFARYRTIAVALALSDAACLAVAVLVVDALGAGRFSPQQLVLPLVAAPVIWMGVFALLGLYRVQRLLVSDHLREVAIAATLGSSLLVLMFLGSHHRSAFAILWPSVLLFEVVSRRRWTTRLKRLRQAGSLELRTVIVGTNDEADRLGCYLLSPGSGFKPLGYVATERIGTANRLHVLGGLGDLAAIARDHAAQCVFVASSDLTPSDMAIVSRVARREQLEVRVGASLPDVLASRVNVEVSNGLVALSITPVRLTAGKATVKRMFDLGIGSCLLLAALPVMAVVAVLVRTSSAGPVLFRQDRVTKGGRVFSILKFRTMFADDRRGAVRDLDPTMTYFKLRDDPRVTPVGRFLRRYSLDELPQLWNVILGDLSLVGPRPLWALQVDSATDTFQYRHEVRAGVTGWWQVNGRSAVDVDEALRMDSFYIENWSLWLDVRILLRTIPTVLSSRAAY